MKRTSRKLFPAVFFIGIIAVMGFGAVNPAYAEDVTITDTYFSVGVVNAVYNQKVGITGGVTPYIWNVLVGSLPAGLSINASTGEITGTPTTCGTSKFTIRVTDSQNPVVTVTKTLSITINPSALIIITASFPDGTVRTAYSQKVKATGGFIPYVWSISVGSLPAGLSLNASTGEIIGRPNTVGTSKFTVQVTDSQKPAAVVIKALSIKIAPSNLPSMWFSPI